MASALLDINISLQIVTQPAEHFSMLKTLKYVNFCLKSTRGTKDPSYHRRADFFIFSSFLLRLLVRVLGRQKGFFLFPEFGSLRDLFRQAKHNLQVVLAIWQYEWQ